MAAAEKLERPGMVKRLFETLSDGEYHSFDELRRLSDSGDIEDVTLAVFVGHLRKAVAGRGLDVRCDNRRYRMVRTLGKDR